MKSTLRILFAATVICVSVPALALEEHVGIYAEKGDPARWYEPIETPRQKYQNVMKEAGAALAEALKECRSQRADRRRCEEDARAQYRRDVEYAREFRSRPHE
ncbi:MAG: hypothetical protein ACXWAC_03480 [Usitatibacter sp.]